MNSLKQFINELVTQNDGNFAIDNTRKFLLHGDTLAVPMSRCNVSSGAKNVLKC